MNLQNLIKDITTGAEIAESTGLSNNTVSRILRGNTTDYPKATQKVYKGIETVLDEKMCKIQEAKEALKNLAA